MTKAERDQARSLHHRQVQGEVLDEAERGLVQKFLQAVSEEDAVRRAASAARQDALLAAKEDQKTSMLLLSLDSPLWGELWHARGKASDIPDLLRALEASPSLDSGGESEEVWHDLWEALCHNDIEIGTASYAALPHIRRIAGRADENSVGLYLHFLTCVERLRLQGKGPSIPDYLESAYFDTIANVPEWVFSLSTGKWDYLLCTAAVAALAVSKGYADLGWLISEMSPDNLRRTKSMFKSNQ